jgi:LacI family transcriptional regulator
MGTVTLKDLAAKLGLSITTVLRALAGYGNAAQTTRHWAREAAREMGYAPTLLSANSTRDLPTPSPLSPYLCHPFLRPHCSADCWPALGENPCP